MLPDNQDALKVWLIQTLNPICDADPDTLANYILALIRKDKPENDLIELCNKDLDDFLQDHTKSFVDTLFEALRSKIYLHEVDRHAGRPQASQKLAHSPSNGSDQTPHLTSYKSLPKRDQEQIRPKEFEMKSRRTERRPEDSSAGSREKWRQDRRYSKSPQSRGRNDQSRERRKFSQVRNRANDQTNPRDVISPPLRLGKRSYTRSLSKSVDPHEVELEHARRSSGEGSGSNSPEGSTKVAKRNRSRSNSRERRDGVKKQRCRMYYELGFCELGDKCLYDHGKNPVLISNRELGLQNSFEYSPSNYLPPPGAPSLIHQTVIPNMSQPPPALPFPPHRLPPAHFITQQGNPLLLTQPPMRPMMPYGMPPTHRPPPPIFPYLPLPTGELQQEVYQPGTVSAVEPYLPEPYSSKSSHFSLPPPPIQTQPTLIKGTWKEEESKPDGSTTLARQVSNLVHVSINEGRVETDSDLLGGDQQYEVASSGDGNVPSYTPTPSSVLNARKRSSKMAGLEQVNLANSEGFGAEDAKLMPPPSSYVKKPTMEHPGENLLPVLGVTNRNQSASNTTLELRKIPREDNTISNINGHFSKFGIIINLQVNWDNDPCAALVSYASSAQASAAYRSKEPFLNNRFIKIFWHNPEKSQQHQGGGASQNTPDSRSGDKDYKSKPKYTIPQRHQLQLNRLKKPEEVKKVQEGEVNPEKSEDEASKIGQMPSSEEQQKVDPTSPTIHGENVERIVIPPRSALRLQRKPDKEMQKPVNFQANAMKKELEWRQKTQELLKKLLETQKNLLELHIKSKSPEEKAKYSQLLKNNDVKIQELNEKLKKPLNSSSSPNVDAHNKPFPSHKNKYSKNNKQLVRTNSNSGLDPANHEDSHEAQKAQLDGELDMIANKKEADVLRKKISDIKSVIGNIEHGDLSNEDIDPSSSSSSYSYNKFNYNQATRGGRVFAKVSRSVDRRPRQILITGFPVSLDKSTLLNHMKNFGQVEKSLFDDRTPFFLVTYRYRSDAERAMKDGGMFEDVKLKLAWHNSEPQPAAKQQTPQCVPQAVSSSTFPPSSSSSTHAHLGLVDQKVDDQPESGTSDSNVHSTEEGGSPIGGGNEYGDDDLSDYRKWADVDEDALLYEEDEEDEDDDEGVRPWRRR